MLYDGLEGPSYGIHEVPNRDDDQRSGADVRDEAANKSRAGAEAVADHRGGLILNCGMVSIAVVMLSTPVLCCCTPMVFPLWITGGILGGLAGVMGRRDVRAMRNNAMNPAGRGQTELGMYLGFAGAIMGTLVTLLGLVLTATGALHKLAASFR